MTISGHTLITNPETLGYPYLESIKSFANFCDEVIVVDGGTTDNSLKKLRKIPKVRIVKGDVWEEDFWWGSLGKNINLGYLECKGDWAFHFDTDYIFHEDNVRDLKRKLEDSHLPAAEITKMNFVLSNECYAKDNYALLVNKKDFPAIRYGIGLHERGPECLSFLRPIARKYTRKDGLETGEPIKMSVIRVERLDVPIYTYDFTFMTKKQVIYLRKRFDRALHSFKGNPLRISDKKTLDNFIAMMNTRHQECIKEGTVNIPISKHSGFVRKRVSQLKPSQFGYNGWGLLK